MKRTQLGILGEHYIADILRDDYDEVIIAPPNTPGLDIMTRIGKEKVGWQVKTRDRRTGSDNEYSYIKLSKTEYVDITAHLWGVERISYSVVLLVEDYVEIFWFSQEAYNKYTKRQPGGRPTFNMGPKWRKLYGEDPDVRIEKRYDLEYFIPEQLAKIMNKKDS